jgi:hypothetical protein
MAKTTPTSDGQWRSPPRCPAAYPPTKDETMKKTITAKGLDESGQGPKRAVAGAVAHHLGSN